MKAIILFVLVAAIALVGSITLCEATKTFVRVAHLQAEAN